MPTGGYPHNVKFNNIMIMKMEDGGYKSPQVEILKMVVAQTILTSSFTGEAINEWQDM